MPTPRLLRLQRERTILRRFIEVYCRREHRTATGLCPDCSDLLAYAEERLQRCPHDPKPKCKRCPTHCYKPKQRARIREIMRYSGTHFIKRGRFDWLVRYFLT